MAPESIVKRSYREELTRPLHDHGVINRFRQYLPISETTPIISLNEGSTPLIHSPRLSERAEAEVFVKYEGLNPTGSFKDRGMTMAISKAVENGARAVICASTGNTSASAAAYGARAGLLCAVFLPAGKIAMGKLSQAMMHQATVIQIDGNFASQALSIVKTAVRGASFELVNSINPFRIEGQKTAAMEVCDQLGDAPAVHVLPVGNAGNITAYWKGYKEFFAGQSNDAVAPYDRLPSRRCGADCPRSRGGRSTNRCDGDSDRQSRQLAKRKLSSARESRRDWHR